MRKREEILKDEFGISIDAKDTIPMDKGECIRAMQEYADEFACAFAEWKDKNNYKYFESLNGFISLNIPNEKILTGIELLGIFKN